jgi:two-component system, NarL family, nitrate/nitrite response regulator NarL
MTLQSSILLNRRVDEEGRMTALQSEGSTARYMARWSARGLDVLIVDGHPVVQHGVRMLLEDADRVRSANAAETGEEAIEIARRERPDMVLLDPWLPDMLMAEAVSRIRAVSPGSKIVIFAAHLTPTIREEAARLDVNGVLGKDARPQRLLDAIERIASGELITDPIEDELLRRAGDKLHCAPLTPREHEILRRAARGESNAEIAQAIYLAPTTVKSYLQCALRKLGARNRVEAVFKLSELRLL